MGAVFYRTMTDHKHHHKDPAVDPKQQQQAESDASFDALSASLDKLTKREAEMASREAELSKSLAELTESLARSRADHSNLLKRLDREKAETHVFVVGKTVGKLLPGIDTLERALAHLPDDRKNDPWTQGIVAAHKAFLKGLESLDVRPFATLGLPLDETRHEAVAHVPGTAETIVAEFEKGYLFGDRVLRHAKVAVGNGEPVAPATPSEGVEK